MAIDLTPRWQNFAVYLPAQQFGFASVVDSDKHRDKLRPFPANIKLTDLDFLNAKSKLWHYGYTLYSAGQFTSARPQACAVSNRDRTCTTILGDSGGFQIGSGTLKGTEHLKNAKTTTELCDAWRNNKDVAKWIVNWLDTHSDYAMTIDMPLWARFPANKKSPFHKCSVDELIDLTVGNLEYIKHTTRGTTKWLNVLQGTDAKDSKQWWDAVKKYKLGGWALASMVGWRGGLENVLRSVLTIRDEGGFEAGQDWLHVLGTSTPVWAVLLTAIQRGIRAKANPLLRVSYDSASPFQLAGRFQKVVRYPKFGSGFDSWSLTAHEAPINPMYATNTHQFPFASPLGDLMTLQHLNVRGGEFQSKPVDTVGSAMLTNHNVYVYVRALLEANELAFMGISEADKCVPQVLLDACAFIEDLMGQQNWAAKLKKEQTLLQHKAFSATTANRDGMD